VSRAAGLKRQREAVDMPVQSMFDSSRRSLCSGATQGSMGIQHSVRECREGRCAP